MSRPPASPHTGRLVLLVWLLVASFYFRISYDYIGISMNDEKFVQDLEYIVQTAGAENRPAREVREYLLVKAEDMQLPIRGNQITITGSGISLSVVVTYDIDIDIPILDRGIYHKHFEHKARYKSPR